LIANVNSLFDCKRKLQRINNLITKEGRMVESPLCLRLGSLRSDGKVNLIFCW